MGIRRVGEHPLCFHRRLDFVVRKFPVSRIGDEACRFRFNVQVVKAAVVECGIGVSADAEGLRRAGCLDVPDVNIPEMRQPLLFGKFWWLA